MNNVEYKQQNSLYPKRAQLPQVNNNFENQVFTVWVVMGAFCMLETQRSQNG